MTRPILLVDDHAAIRRGISDILTAEIDGLEFGFAGSEAEAMNALGSKTWELVTVDLNLPGRGGLDLIRNIKGLNRAPKILVYTMHSEDQLVIRALRAGADGIYMLGTGWRCLDIVHLLEEDLQVPVVHAVPARVWAVQKRLHIRQKVKGFGKLLEEMP